MKFLDLTLPTPAENLACDEQLLDAAERGNSGEVLRVWESPEPFVVVGYGQTIATEVNVAACAAKKIPVLRRCSGGGTVVQGPGCLSYALVLEIAANAELKNITAANRFIMERNREAVEGEVRIQNPESRIEICGHTDLALNTQHSTLNTSQKFSGNAQRRRRHFLLFHGTFLLDFDLALVNELLPLPSRQPDYRASRAHEKFLMNLQLPAATLKSALRTAWLG
jgi:lipoate-protein ligase A